MIRFLRTFKGFVQNIPRKHHQYDASAVNVSSTKNCNLLILNLIRPTLSTYRLIVFLTKLSSETLLQYSLVHTYKEVVNTALRLFSNLNYLISDIFIHLFLFVKTQGRQMFLFRSYEIEYFFTFVDNDKRPFRKFCQSGHFESNFRT